MLYKLSIVGEIELVTGMHIGGANEFSAIGAVDSPIAKDPLKNLPYIPGSSLKGKLRYLLSRKYNNRIVSSHSDDGEEITRLFGSSEKENIKSSRVIVTDMILANNEEFENLGISPTEVKFENTIDRKTAIANPRQIERSIRGSKFPLDIVYTSNNKDEIYRDLELLKESFDLLEYDYIGGSGSRGYGRIKFNDLKINLIFGEIEEEKLKEIQELFNRGE